MTSHGGLVVVGGWGMDAGWQGFFSAKNRPTSTRINTNTQLLFNGRFILWLVKKKCGGGEDK